MMTSLMPLSRRVQTFKELLFSKVKFFVQRNEFEAFFFLAQIIDRRNGSLLDRSISWRSNEKLVRT